MEPLSRTFDQDGTAVAEGPRLEHRPFLFVVFECGRPLAGGARHALDDLDSVTVGRGATRRFERRGRAGFLSLPDKLVSTRHARFERSGEGWVFVDLDSRNGSRKDGVLVTRAPLGDRALLEIGGTFLAFHAALPSPVGTPGDVELGGAPEGSRPSSLLPSYQRAIDDLLRVAASTLPVLLLGESGSGKEVMARAIHDASARPGALVALNCGALPASLIEGQLFGHARGAFSGAVKDEPGLVRASDRGTLFLDEIAELPLGSQATLLRVLQEREVLPIGATKPVRVDLRVVAATHQRIDRLPATVFRADLYARLAGFTLRLLPLRARREDLGVLLASLLPELAGARARELTFSPPVGRALLGYAWPLNVRELAQALHVALVLAGGSVGSSHVDVLHLPEPIRRVVLPDDAPESVAALTTPPRSRRSRAPTPPSAWGSPTRRTEDGDAKLRGELVGLLERHRGNVSEVARLMGRTRMQIHRWMKRFGLDPEAYRGA